jgi:hypothetical protein
VFIFDSAIVMTSGGRKTPLGQNLFKEYKPDMEALLNGLEIVKK